MPGTIPLLTTCSGNLVNVMFEEYVEGNVKEMHIHGYECTVILSNSSNVYLSIQEYVSLRILTEDHHTEDQ
ncbi:hypothetical protein EV175_000201 [Coemansia sp. RSA 1933]|nr:hypothetical protein EV175_000201 [Coemansia sp. RSA 1933]